mmetsp:Transcript_30333/g.53309  ORF Transcript_30333/g.53309 Transcript_30333/m.53309 type:complete len:462 (+) Transcript_30333:1564-2949(+)
MFVCDLARFFGICALSEVFEFDFRGLLAQHLGQQLHVFGLDVARVVEVQELKHAPQLLFVRGAEGVVGMHLFVAFAAVRVDLRPLPLEDDIDVLETPLARARPLGSEVVVREQHVLGHSQVRLAHAAEAELLHVIERVALVNRLRDDAFLILPIEALGRFREPEDRPGHVAFVFAGEADLHLLLLLDLLLLLLLGLLFGLLDHLLIQRFLAGKLQGISGIGREHLNVVDGLVSGLVALDDVRELVGHVLQQACERALLQHRLAPHGEVDLFAEHHNRLAYRLHLRPKVLLESPVAPTAHRLVRVDIRRVQQSLVALFPVDVGGVLDAELHELQLLGPHRVGQQPSVDVSRQAAGVADLLANELQHLWNDKQMDGLALADATHPVAALREVSVRHILAEGDDCSGVHGLFDVHSGGVDLIVERKPLSELDPALLERNHLAGLEERHLSVLSVQEHARLHALR